MKLEFTQDDIQKLIVATRHYRIIVERMLDVPRANHWVIKRDEALYEKLIKDLNVLEHKLDLADGCRLYVLEAQSFSLVYAAFEDQQHDGGVESVT